MKKVTKGGAEGMEKAEGRKAKEGGRVPTAERKGDEIFVCKMYR